MATANPAEISRFESVRRVVAEPLKFKAKLAIGEDAFASLQTARPVGDLWQVGTAATAGGLVASSSAVAGTFFGGGWLATLGIGAAVTPVGWVVGAAVASGAACYGVQRLFRSYEGMALPRPMRWGARRPTGCITLRPAAQSMNRRCGTATLPPSRRPR